MTLFLFDCEFGMVLEVRDSLLNAKHFIFFLFEIRISLCSEIGLFQVLVTPTQSQGQILDNFSVLLLHHVICEHHQVA